MTAGYLYVAPLGTEDGPWFELGVADSCDFTYPPEDDRPIWGGPTSATFTMQTSRRQMRQWMRLLAPRHPRLRKIRQAYRARKR